MERVGLRRGDFMIIEVRNMIWGGGVYEQRSFKLNLATDH